MYRAAHVYSNSKKAAVIMGIGEVVVCRQFNERFNQHTHLAASVSVLA